MDSLGNEAWNYGLKVMELTGIQLFILLGPLIVLSIMMHFISLEIGKYSIELMGRNSYLLLFGWLGISVHEIGHALFALIFCHKINKIKLFSSNPEEGSMGYVDHSYNPNNVYHQIGNFFIGIGPILLGTFLLFIISLFIFEVNIFKLIPFETNDYSITTFTHVKTTSIAIWEALVNFIQLIWNAENSTGWKMILYIYSLFSIGSSITLSKSDVLSAWKGFLFIILLLLVFNMSTFWIGNYTESIIDHIGDIILVFCFIILISIVINLFFLGIIIILNSIKKRIK